MYKRIKIGFSLAETLLAMVILGVILAFILPSITSTKPSESKLLYKKTFFTVSEAMMAVVNNPDLYDTTQYEVLKHPIQENENFCQYLASYLNTVGNINCEGNTGSFKLANGVTISNIPQKAMQRQENSSGTTVWEEVTDAEAENTLYFKVKTNNKDDNENDSDCSKRNIFKIRYSANGKIYTTEEDQCENSILETGTKIQRDGE